MMTTCYILGAVCIAYYVFLVIHAGIMVNFGWFWAALGAAFFLAGGLRRFPDKAGAVWLSRILTWAIAAGLVVLGVVSAFVIRSMKQPLPRDLQCAVVLGAQVKGKRPSRALGQRLKAAVKVAEKYPQIPLILSGGQGPGELITEAECMRNYLIQHGVGENRLILENRSTTTRENLLFSDELSGCAGKRCGIITNDFHIYRALKIAKKAGYRHVYGIPAKGEPAMEPHFIVREAAALIYGRLRTCSEITA